MSEFETKDEVLKYINDTKDKFIVFKIGADWCKPCKKIKTFYNEVCAKNNYTSTLFYNLDVDSDDSIMDFMNDYGLKKIPHFVIFKNGSKVDSLQTSKDNKLQQFLDKNLGFELTEDF